MLSPEMHMPPGHLLGCALEEEDVLPEGAAWRLDRANTVQVFGVTELAAQDRVVKDAEELVRRRGWTRRSFGIEFWSGEPPPRRGEPYHPSRRRLRTEGVPARADRPVVAPRINDLRAAVLGAVRDSGAVPPGGRVQGKGSTILVHRVEDVAAQDAIVAEAREARARHASPGMEDTFEQVVFDRFVVTHAPDGRMSADMVVIRTVKLD